MRPSDSWRPVRRVEMEYASQLESILQKYFQEFPTEQPEPSRLLAAAEWLTKYAWTAASRMVTALRVANARSWQEAAKKSLRGNEIYRALQIELSGPTGKRVRALTEANAALIRSLPEDVARAVTAHIAGQQQRGERASTMEAYIRHVSRVKARLIARTETSKASTALTRARAEDLNLPWYVWQTSEDSRVRLSHRKMQGILCSWSDPPSPELLAGEKSEGHYQAGDIYNCRCYPAPLVRLDTISWPHKVYYGGRIQRLTLNNFRSLSNLQPATAA